MNKRRSFLKTLAVGIGLTSLAFLPKRSIAKKEIMENVLLHHVYFWLHEPNSAAVREQFEKALAKLVQVETIQQSHLGVPASTESRDVVDHSYTYSFLCVFQSKGDQDIYQKHPIHLKFVEENSKLWGKVVVYDSTDIKA